MAAICTAINSALHLNMSVPSCIHKLELRKADFAKLHLPRSLRHHLHVHRPSPLDTSCHPLYPPVCWIRRLRRLPRCPVRSIAGSRHCQDTVSHQPLRARTCCGFTIIRWRIHCHPLRSRGSRSQRRMATPAGFHRLHCHRERTPSSARNLRYLRWLPRRYDRGCAGYGVRWRSCFNAGHVLSMLPVHYCWPFAARKVGSQQGTYLCTSHVQSTAFE
jgi:hypothetical protein